MAEKLTYVRVNWEDSPSENTPINSENLNKMDAAIEAVVNLANRHSEQKIDAPSVAEVGQTIVVKSVDENGKPIEWECVDAGDKQVQADWNQNDPEAPDYVKNRPFWTDDPVETVIVEETTFELVDGLGMIISSQPLEAGTEYVVTLDGTSYNCICKMDAMLGVPYIGNIGLVGFGGENTGELFFVAPSNISETELGIVVYGDVLEHTVKIVGMICKVHKIDEKYLPVSSKSLAASLIAMDEDFYLFINPNINTNGEFEILYPDGDIGVKYDKLYEAIEWAAVNNGKFYNFLLNQLVDVSIIPASEYIDDYDCIRISSEYCYPSIDGIYHVIFNYIWYKDDDSNVWGNCEYFYELIN